MKLAHQLYELPKIGVSPRPTWPPLTLMIFLVIITP
jgi:hypothetical protein